MELDENDCSIHKDHIDSFTGYPSASGYTVYVDEMGSFITLYGFFTDFEFAEDNWQEVRMMDKLRILQNLHA
jgi:hypothetical protein